jgi:D-glycero-alpha-D-manno-heptose-7-phosphate kinase
MIITRTPFRVSFVGGGTDVPEFYCRYPGAVLNTSINKFIYISSHKIFGGSKYRLKYSITENCESIKDIKHPIFREVLMMFPEDGPLEISSNGDVPSGTGLGSSSAFTVSLLHNMHVRNSEYVTKEKLALEACNLEMNILKEPTGRQDQYASAIGGFNVFIFNSDGTVSIEPVCLKSSTMERLQNDLHVYYTGSQRQASTILKTQNSINNVIMNESVLRNMVDIVWETRDALYSDNLYEFGELLNDNWILKKKLATGITNPYIDDLYDKGIKSGAVGGKLLGAGGGGFLLFYCPEEKTKLLDEAMKPLKKLDFKFEKEGSRVLFVGDEQ